jgi:hypothetical protein
LFYAEAENFAQKLRTLRIVGTAASSDGGILDRRWRRCVFTDEQPNRVAISTNNLPASMSDAMVLPPSQELEDVLISSDSVL